ncbi:MAG: O-antigen ligase family protein [Candidatus Shapirobacteria bacterium]|nr:O-antigen ligase family protein [Candidatus Shapirobacteria bacterium]
MKKISKIINLCFLILFFITPIIFTLFNSELFELPKMYFIYLMTIITVTLHLINWSKKNTPLFRHTFLDIPLILFLISQTISTFISIDIHTSFFGYYSRLNGGLLSLISFSLLYWVLTIYINDQFKSKIINTLLISGFLVAAFGITEHFGIDKNLWVQDVQSRVFSTLGQPNWLATFLVILLPLSISQFLKSINFKSKIYYLIIIISFYSCLLFTKSKSGIIAGLISIALYFIFYLFNKNKKVLSNLKIISPIIIIITLSSIFISNPIKDKILPQKSNIKNTNSQTMNLNITPSEDIRKIVWKGAFDLWKQYPIFGTGTETFAYSYYWTRPIEHNLTSEWDFLYNKAHNEYLNFLATTGAFGFISYLLLLTIILIKTFKNKPIFCSLLGFLITNLVGFSVVTTSLLFFLLPSLILDENNKKPKLKNTKKILIPFFILIGLILIVKNINFYLADIFYNKSIKHDHANNYQTSYQLINQSLNLRPNEPEYLVQTANLSAKLAITTKEAKYIDDAINYINQAIKISPANISFWQQRAQIFYYLTSLNNQYFQESINSLLQITTLAPTNAKNFFTIGQFLESANFVDQAIPYYQKAIELKSNYDHAYFALGQIYFNKKEYILAKENLELDLKYAPTNTDAQDLLNKIK